MWAAKAHAMEQLFMKPHRSQRIALRRARLIGTSVPLSRCAGTFGGACLVLGRSGHSLDIRPEASQIS